MSPEHIQKRKQVYDYFVKVAREENNKNNRVEFSSLFDGKGDIKALLVAPESIGDVFMITSLFKSIKDLYPNSDLYVATKPQFFQLLEGNEYIYKIIPYSPEMENELQMTGAGEHKGFVDVLYLPTLPTQRQLNYISKSKIALDLKNE